MIIRMLKGTRAIVTLELALLIPIMWMFLAGAFDLVNLLYTSFGSEQCRGDRCQYDHADSAEELHRDKCHFPSVLQYVNAASSPINIAGTRTWRGHRERS